MEELRKVEVFKDGVWKEIQFVDLEVGDNYRMFESDGEPVVGKGAGDPIFEGTTAWVVTKAPYEHPDSGVLTVECTTIAATALLKMYGGEEV